jgi:hypothetical protein
LNEKCRGLLRELLDLVKEAHQEVPSWFESFVYERGGGGGFGGRKYVGAWRGVAVT